VSAPLLTSILTFATAVIGFAILFVKVKEVHVLVNSNLTKVMAALGIEQDRTAQLKDAMKGAGVDVPPRPGSPEAGERLAPARGEDPGVGPGR
jgi:hypothetical protein